MPMQSINPATEEVLATFEEFTPEQTERAITEADDTFRHWRDTTVGAECLRRVRDLDVELRVGQCLERPQRLAGRRIHRGNRHSDHPIA